MARIIDNNCGEPYAYSNFPGSFGDQVGAAQAAPVFLPVYMRDRCPTFTAPPTRYNKTRRAW